MTAKRKPPKRPSRTKLTRALNLARRYDRGERDNIPVNGLPWELALALLAEIARLRYGTCRECGCTDDYGCDGGCSWVNAEHTLCSECVEGAP